MTVLDSLKSFFVVQQTKRWSDDERKALVRLFYDVITADGIVDAAELETIEKASHTWDIPLAEITHLGIGWAMGVLTKDPRKLKTACLADAFFVDGDLDESEQAFIEKLSTTYQIPDDVLRSTVADLRQHKLDDALKAIHDEAFNAPMHENTPVEDSAHRRDVDDV